MVVAVPAALEVSIDFNADAPVAALPADSEAAVVVPVELPLPTVIAAIVDVAAPPTAALLAAAIDPPVVVSAPSADVAATVVPAVELPPPAVVAAKTWMRQFL